MIIKIEKPHPDYPFAWIYVDEFVDVEGEKLKDTLTKIDVTLLGPWEYCLSIASGGLGVDQRRAPILLEDEHVKPSKKRIRKK